MKESPKFDFCRSFAPAGDLDAPQILILGSMPGVESLRRQQYYAFERNAFWRIAGTVFDFDYHLNYPARLAALAAKHVALWDVFQICNRNGSSDSNIRNAVPNDLASFIGTYPTIKVVIGNGGSASNGFRRHFPGYTNLLRQVPSTSPAAAGMSFEDKLSLWRRALYF